MPLQSLARAVCRPVRNLWPVCDSRPVTAGWPACTSAAPVLSEGLCLEPTLVMTDRPGLSEAGHLSEDPLRIAGLCASAGREMRERARRRAMAACTQPAPMAWRVDIGASSSTPRRR